MTRKNLVLTLEKGKAPSVLVTNLVFLILLAPYVRETVVAEATIKNNVQEEN